MAFKKMLLALAYRMEASEKYKANKNVVFELLEDQTSGKKKYFDFVMIFLVLTTIMILILEIKNDLPPFVYYYERFAVFIFISEWLGRLWVSSNGHKTTILTHEEIQAKEQKASAWALVKPAILEKFRFAISPMSIIDLLAILPSYRPLRMLRIFLLFRLFKVFR